MQLNIDEQADSFNRYREVTSQGFAEMLKLTDKHRENQDQMTKVSIKHGQEQILKVTDAIVDRVDELTKKLANVKTPDIVG